MSIRTVDPDCRICHRPLRDKASRYRRVGPDCWARLTDSERAEALELAAAERDPFRITDQGPASVQARINNHNARAAADPDAVQLCHHENRAGACPDCRREADPARAAERILREVRAQTYAQRRAERIAVQTARAARGIPAPARRPARPRARKRRAAEVAGPVQMELA